MKTDTKQAISPEEAFCKKAGVQLVDCGPGWGGKIGIRKAGSNFTLCGYRTPQEAYRGFIRAECGVLADQVLKLLKQKKAT